MIVFVSNYPDASNMRDGMMQRVDAIDSLVKDKKRVYLDISFKRNFKRKKITNHKCTIEHVNFFVHFFIIKSILKDASKIYIHSLYNLLKVYPFFAPKKTILDIHGVVPEEVKLVGRVQQAKIYDYIEKKAIQKCSKLIHVTESMLQHYETKYKIMISNRSIVLPIFESHEVYLDDDKWKELPLNVVYAGGLQAWQNITLMVDTVSTIETSTLVNNYVFKFFFPENQLKNFSNKYKKTSHFKNLSFSSLPKKQIIPLLQTCHLGFVLRDDILVNKVACPTKLIEYLECGVVPIVKSPDIGDFNRLGYEFILIDDFIGNDFAIEDVKIKAEHNYKILKIFREKTEKSKVDLIEEFN
ncbi:hypothetical protein [Rahnella aquatilis]|uniref:hypothetical protein n=1 Tax=Rahnella aquatilis TaxID=34038 RepID=UPI000907899B|nr:hypothetical protein [Rahnella aquatilis]